MHTIICRDAVHGATINALARDGKIKPLKFRTPDGDVHTANSTWAASEYWKEHGYYAQDLSLDDAVIK